MWDILAAAAAAAVESTGPSKHSTKRAQAARRHVAIVYVTLIFIDAGLAICHARHIHVHVASKLALFSFDHQVNIACREDRM